jgi:hypothetical protein
VGTRAWRRSRSQTSPPHGVEPFVDSLPRLILPGSSPPTRRDLDVEAVPRAGETRSRARPNQ